VPPNLITTLWIFRNFDESRKTLFARFDREKGIEYA
jgi:hypothetical protein